MATPLPRSVLPKIRLQPKDRPDRGRVRKLLAIHTRPTTDLEPETRRLLAESRKVNFGKPIKTVRPRKKTKAMEFQEAKARLMVSKPGKREQHLIDFHLRRAAELEKAGNGTEAAFFREQADTVRQNGMAIREVFAENVARHEKEIRENLAMPSSQLMKKRKQRITQEKAALEKMLADAKTQDAEKQNTVNERLAEALEELRAKKKGAH